MRSQDKWHERTSDSPLRKAAILTWSNSSFALLEQGKGPANCSLWSKIVRLFSLVSRSELIKAHGIDYR